MADDSRLVVLDSEDATNRAGLQLDVRFVFIDRIPRAFVSSGTLPKELLVICRSVND